MSSRRLFHLSSVIPSAFVHSWHKEFWPLYLVDLLQFVHCFRHGITPLLPFFQPRVESLIVLGLVNHIVHSFDRYGGGFRDFTLGLP